jgi:hypothetical protein
VLDYLTAEENYCGFEKKISARLSKDMADLIPDEVLSGMVSRAIEDMFFKERKLSVSNYGEAKVAPSWFQQEVEKALRCNIAVAAGNWLENDKDRLMRVFEDASREVVPRLVLEALLGLVDTSAHNVERNIKNILLNAEIDVG